MSLYQREVELENVKLVSATRDEVKAKLETVSVEFDAEIKLLSTFIDKWRVEDRASRDMERKAYKELLDALPSERLAEVTIRAMFESILTVAAGEPVTYVRVVDHALIQGKLKSILPHEERVIPIQFKFATVDLLVARTVKFLPSLFKEGPYRKNEQESIELTEAAKERLGNVSIQDVLTDVPMLCEPSKWTSVFHGGFLTSEMQKGNPLVGSRYHDYKELLAIDRSLQENPEILESINKMQGVAFRIDRNFAKYQKTIDEVRRSKLVDVQAKIDVLDKKINDLEALQDLEKSLEA